MLDMLAEWPLHQAEPQFLRTVAWTLAILCRFNPPPDFEIVRPMLPTVARIIQQCKDDDVLAEACWALCYLTNNIEWNVGHEDRIQVVLDALDAQAWRWRHPVGHPLTSHEITIQVGSVTPTRLMAHEAAHVQTPALRLIGNVVSGTDAQTQLAVVSGALPVLCMLLNHPEWKVRKEAMWTISNIAGGTQEQVQAVLDAGILSPVFDALKHINISDKYSRAMKKEAAWVILNCVNGGSAESKGVIGQHVKDMGDGIQEALVSENLHKINVPNYTIIHLLSLWSSNAVNKGSSELIELNNAVLAWQDAHKERINDYELLRIIAGIRCGWCNAGHHVLTTRSGESGGTPVTGASA